MNNWSSVLLVLGINRLIKRQKRSSKSPWHKDVMKQTSADAQKGINRLTVISRSTSCLETVQHMHEKDKRW